MVSLLFSYLAQSGLSNLNYFVINTLLFSIDRYSQICIKRSPLGPRKSGLIRQVTS